MAVVLKSYHQVRVQREDGSTYCIVFGNAKQAKDHVMEIRGLFPRDSFVIEFIEIQLLSLSTRERFTPIETIPALETDGDVRESKEIEVL